MYSAVAAMAALTGFLFANKFFCINTLAADAKSES